MLYPCSCTQGKHNLLVSTFRGLWNHRIQREHILKTQFDTQFTIMINMVEQIESKLSQNLQQEIFFAILGRWWFKMYRFVTICPTRIQNFSHFLMHECIYTKHFCAWISMFIPWMVVEILQWLFGMGTLTPHKMKAVKIPKLWAYIHLLHSLQGTILFCVNWRYALPHNGQHNPLLRCW